MEIAIVILFSFIFLYAGFIVSLIFGFEKIKTFKAENTTPRVTFSIIIPLRNEQQNLPVLLRSLANIAYPRELFELIFVDDFSEDASVSLINKWRMENGQIQTTVIENLHLSGSPKKDALSRAVPIARNKWIITTDADCALPAKWLSMLNTFILAKSADMVVGTVACDGSKSLLNQFQRSDFLSLQGATIGSFGIGKPFMCNGANLVYSKEMFLAVGGFKGNDTIASGDDVFLLQKAVAQSKRVFYLKSVDNIVTTKPVPGWGNLFDQRVRWASKTPSYDNVFGQDLAVVVFAGNFTIVAALILYAGGLLDIAYLCGLAVVKLIPDLILLIQTNRFIYRGKFFFPIFSVLIYPFFCVAVAVYSIFGVYHWKGRVYQSNGRNRPIQR